MLWTTLSTREESTASNYMYMYKRERTREPVKLTTAKNRRSVPSDCRASNRTPLSLKGYRTYDLGKDDESNRDEKRMVLETTTKS